MTFLTAEWRKLMMVNYVVPPELLQPYVPFGTELDLWQGRCYLSLVGFMFVNTRVLGLSIPFHRNFEEVNLRFYVRRKTGGEERRGVVFISEIVPKPAISLIANFLYREHYTTRRMGHLWEFNADQHRFSYEWRPFFKRQGCRMTAITEPRAYPMASGSEAEFITEHYWGYAAAGKQHSNEYAVQHPRWEVYKVISHQVEGNFDAVYGPEFGKILKGPCASVFVAEGSEIAVLGKAKI